MRGDVLEEEILTIEDKAASSGVLPLVPTSLQRLVLRRVKHTDLGGDDRLHGR
jgi:hypothetical protein